MTSWPGSVFPNPNTSQGDGKFSTTITQGKTFQEDLQFVPKAIQVDNPGDFWIQLLPENKWVPPNYMGYLIPWTQKVVTVALDSRSSAPGYPPFSPAQSNAAATVTWWENTPVSGGSPIKNFTISPQILLDSKSFPGLPAAGAYESDTINIPPGIHALGIAINIAGNHQSFPSNNGRVDIIGVQSGLTYATIAPTNSISGLNTNWANPIIVPILSAIDTGVTIYIAEIHGNIALEACTIYIVGIYDPSAVWVSNTSPLLVGAPASSPLRTFTEPYNITQPAVIVAGVGIPASSTYTAATNRLTTDLLFSWWGSIAVNNVPGGQLVFKFHGTTTNIEYDFDCIFLPQNNPGATQVTFHRNPTRSLGTQPDPNDSQYNVLIQNTCTVTVFVSLFLIVGPG